MRRERQLAQQVADAHSLGVVSRFGSRANTPSFVARDHPQVEIAVILEPDRRRARPANDRGGALENVQFFLSGREHAYTGLK